MRLAFVFVLMFVVTNLVQAETTRHTRTTTTTTVESDDAGIDAPPEKPATTADETGYAPPADALPAPKNAKAPVGAFMDSELSQTFGSTATSGMSGCKTEMLSKSVVKDLKRECSAWVKEQRADLGKSYLGNTCEESCDECGMTLVRCKVTGTIRYRKIVGEIDAQ